MTEEIMTDKPDHGGWEPWEPEAGAAREVWDAFWAAMPSNDQDVPDGDTEEVNRLLTANPHLAREMPLLGGGERLVFSRQRRQDRGPLGVLPLNL